MARIIDTDNFGGDYPDEHFHLCRMSPEQAQRICDILNNEVLDQSAPRFYRVVADDYKPQPGFEP